MNWTTADNLFALIVLIMGIRGAIRGFIRSFFGLLGILCGFLVAAFLFRDAAGWIEWTNWSFVIRATVMFTLLFIVTGVTIRMFGGLLSMGAEKSGMSPANRVFGFLFGLLQGSIIIIAISALLLLSTSTTGYRTWAERGTFSGLLIRHADVVAKSTLEVSSKMRNLLLTALSKWGMPPELIDRIFADPALVSELSGELAKHAVPDSLRPPHKSLYSKLEPVLSDPFLTPTDKAQRVWDLLSTERMPIGAVADSDTTISTIRTLP